MGDITVWAVGILSGMCGSLGIGGGGVLIMYLTAFTAAKGAEAAGINLLFFLPIALLSLIIHAKNKLIEWKAVLTPLIFGLPGAALGWWLSAVTDDFLLKKGFGVLLLGFGLYYICGGFRKKSEKETGS